MPPFTHAHGPSPQETAHRRQSSQGTLPTKLTALTPVAQVPRGAAQASVWKGMGEGPQPPASPHPEDVLSESSGGMETLSVLPSFTERAGASLVTSVLTWLWKEKGVTSQDSVGTGRPTVYQALSKLRPLHPKEPRL